MYRVIVSYLAWQLYPSKFLQKKWKSNRFTKLIQNTAGNEKSCGVNTKTHLWDQFSFPLCCFRIKDCTKCSKPQELSMTRNDFRVLIFWAHRFDCQVYNTSMLLLLWRVCKTPEVSTIFFYNRPGERHFSCNVCVLFMILMGASLLNVCCIRP